MKLRFLGRLTGLTFSITLLAAASSAQWGTPNAYGYNTGYGTVYGTFSHAALMQSMYNVARSEQLNRNRANPPQADRAGQAKASPTAVVRNYGLFRPDATVDTGKLLSESLGSTPEEKALIKRIYTATKEFYEKEATAKGWKNNIAGGVTFFTATAVTIYHDTEEPSPDGADIYFKAVNASIDAIPEFGSMPDKDKQHFNNMMIGFGGMLLAVYTEGKQNNNAETIANSKKLAGMLLQMVLKADPENIRIENGRIVLK